ncbi:MAG TPA: hypothetical protein VEZ17_12380, partial [Chitinophagaceae bacterium]|nr:hypothetical protein [Chitinophagaceae bacterium]
MVKIGESFPHNRGKTRRWVSWKSAWEKIFFKKWIFSRVFARHEIDRNCCLKTGAGFVARPGFEPRQTVPKTVVLPLYYR